MPLEAGAHRRCLVRLGKDGIERGFDVAVGNAAAAQLSRDTEATLPAGLCVMANVFKRVAGVVKILLLAEARDNGGNRLLILGAAPKVIAHLVNGVRAAHQCTDSRRVQLLLGFKLARRGTGTHRESLEARRQGSKDRVLKDSTADPSPGPLARIPSG